MAKLQPVTKLIVTYAISLLAGFMVSLVILYHIIRKGTKTVFYRKKYETRPKIFIDAAVGKHGYVTLESGLKLHTVTQGAVCAPLMLFLHGFPECWYSWRHQMKEFSRDYRVVAVDMRGYGESDKPSRVADYELTVLANDIKELVEALGVSSCVLVVHDWGGIVGQVFALQHPDMVSHLVLCNIPHLTAFQRHITTSWSQKKKSWYLYFFQLPCLPELMFKMNDYKLVEKMFSDRAPGSVSRPALETLEQKDALKFALSSSDGLSCPFNYYRALLRYTPPHLGTLTMPTLAVFGIHDRAIDRETVELSRAYVTDMSVCYVETATHWVQQQAPDEVNAHIRDFLQEKKDK